MSLFPEKGVAIVTGGSGGIGSVICRAFAEAGTDVAFTYNKNEAAAQDTVAAVAAVGRQARAIPVDLRDEVAVKEFIASAAQDDGIHTVVTAHGPYVHMRHASRIDPATLKETLDADVMAAYHVIHAALPYLRETRGSIVSISSPAVRRTINKYLLSCTPKAAIESMVRQVAFEEGRYGVRANALAVGLLSDGIFKTLVDDGSFSEEYVQASVRAIALRRLGTAEEIADGVIFLASDKARWVTGQILTVDGGFDL